MAMGKTGSHDQGKKCSEIAKIETNIEKKYCFKIFLFSILAGILIRVCHCPIRHSKFSLYFCYLQWCSNAQEPPDVEG